MLVMVASKTRSMDCPFTMYLYHRAQFAFARRRDLATSVVENNPWLCTWCWRQCSSRRVHVFIVHRFRFSEAKGVPGHARVSNLSWCLRELCNCALDVDLQTQRDVVFCRFQRRIGTDRPRRVQDQREHISFQCPCLQERRVRLNHGGQTKMTKKQTTKIAFARQQSQGKGARRSKGGREDARSEKGRYGWCLTSVAGVTGNRSQHDFHWCFHPG